ncbi:MAG: asparagine synthetase B [Methanosphaera sp.]|uniref:asparagine synthetase B family protein n=1 Tax=Methanosphaera sp. TaxID=2666342 RepID=UPI0025CB8D11|nr:asparagine synthetase B [Methanosphaera sp.]MCI5867075.1 asparagine synthetase B [Methanosphaera sp.]MDY3956539.1 asparagine synthetase B [Methanosphaera sp.]
MCSIVGINGKFSCSDVEVMLETLKHRGPDGYGIYTDGNIYYNCFDDINSCDDGFIMAHNLLSIVGDVKLQPFKCGDLTIVANAELYNYKQLIDDFNLDIDASSCSDCEIIVEIIERNYNGNLYDAVIKSIDVFDGDYAFAITDGCDYIVMRDNYGIKPLYYGCNSDKFAFASEQKALKSIGITDIENLNPRCMIYNDKIIKYRSEPKRDIFYDDYNTAVEDLKDALTQSVAKRVEDLESVAVLFSAGVDSSIVVQILKNLEKDIQLYTVGVENSQDLKVARNVASDMHLPLNEWVIDQEVVENYFYDTIDTIESNNIMKIGVGMTIKLTSKLAHDDGYKVMLTGQGADELFAGYNRYAKKYDTPDLLYQELECDLNNIYNVNLERDDKSAMSNSVELRVPFLDFNVVDVAVQMPYNYLIHSNDDKIRKHILRDVALKLGLPEDVAKRPKKAAQYATGIDKTIRKKLLKKDEYRKLIEN